ncbi:MAG TPA: antitoxin Xre/MbcA/ParS toxin-binding domain-containing protein [Caulobacteraceae bacterium]|nr:antitoxin Xre/MbcA/ParS toxin-binding domain-containing protein [Caulobacteraceae bacterium]
MTAVADIQALLGGETVTGPLRSELDLMRLVRRGVPTAAVDRFLETTHLGFGLIEKHVVPRRTFLRRRQSGQRLDPAESDRLVRLTRLVAQATETFGDESKARVWLERRNRSLGGEAPLALADTDLGAREVETLLGRIAHGLAA